MTSSTSSVLTSRLAFQPRKLHRFYLELFFPSQLKVPEGSRGAVCCDVPFLFRFRLDWKIWGPGLAAAAGFLARSCT